MLAVRSDVMASLTCEVRWAEGDGRHRDADECDRYRG